jgi:hypothetical protein
MWSIKALRFSGTTRDNTMTGVAIGRQRRSVGIPAAEQLPDFLLQVGRVIVRGSELEQWVMKVVVSLRFAQGPVLRSRSGFAAVIPLGLRVFPCDGRGMSPHTSRER